MNIFDKDFLETCQKPTAPLEVEEERVYLHLRRNQFMTYSMMKRLCDVRILSYMSDKGLIQTHDVGLPDKVFSINSILTNVNVTASLLSSTFYTHYHEHIVEWNPEYVYRVKSVDIYTEGLVTFKNGLCGILLIGDDEVSWKTRIHPLVKAKVSSVSVITLSSHASKLCRYATVKPLVGDWWFGEPKTIYDSPFGEVWKKPGLEVYMSIV